VVFFLAFLGIVSPRFLVKHFRYAILIIFIIAAIVTPTPDVINMCIFASPMLALYALSIGVAWLVHPDQRKSREAGNEGQSSSSN
jgi:sec-independent protein translocase protein TatC